MTVDVGADLTNQPRSTTVVSGTGTFSDISGLTSWFVNASGDPSSQYRINGGGWTSGSTHIFNGDTIQVRHTTSAGYSGTVSTNIDVSSLLSPSWVTWDTWSSITEAADVDPDHWTYTAAPGVELSSVNTSASHTLTGMNASASNCSVANGEGSVNGGDWSASLGTIQPGDSIRVRGTASGSYSTPVVVSLIFNISTTVATFTITTRAADITPSAFTFTDQGGVATSTLFTSNSVTMAGMDAGQNSPVTFPTKTNGTVVAPATNAYEVNINGAGWVNATGTLNIQNGQPLQLRMGSNGSASVTATFMVDVNGVQDTWTVTTTTPDTTPDAFTFVDNADVCKATVATSNIITISGITAAANVSFSTLGGSSHEYRKNGGAWTAVGATTVNNGDTLQVRATVPGTAGQTAAITMTVGGVSDTYTATAQEPHTTPTAFAFVDATGIDPITVTVSAAITVAGINTATAISVVGGEYSVNGGSFTSSAGTVNLGDSVQARVTSATALSASVSVTVTIGGVSDDFVVTTRSPDTSKQYVLTFREAVYGVAY
jgi:hypothetical protein